MRCAGKLSILKGRELRARFEAASSPEQVAELADEFLQGVADNTCVSHPVSLPLTLCTCLPKGRLLRLLLWGGVLHTARCLACRTNTTLHMAYAWAVCLDIFSTSRSDQAPLLPCTLLCVRASTGNVLSCVTMQVNNGGWCESWSVAAAGIARRAGRAACMA